MILVHDEWDAPLLARLRAETGETVEAAAQPTEEQLAHAQVYLTQTMDEETLARCQSLRLLFTLSAGVERLPFAALAARGVAVANASGVHPQQMSEQILGVMLGFSRALFTARDRQARREWNRHVSVGALAGAVLLVVGTGRIGRAVAARAAAFGMRVRGIRRTPAPLPEFETVRPLSALPEELPQADYVVLLTPLTDETRGLFDARLFACMKKSAVFINYARGGEVDESALIEALQSGRIAGAGLDVFAVEPLPEESPLWGMPNVFITSHSAGFVPGYMERALELFLQNWRAWRAHEPLPTGVQLTRGY